MTVLFVAFIGGVIGSIIGSTLVAMFVWYMLYEEGGEE